MLLRILSVVLNSYLLSGIMLAPLVIIMRTIHVRIEPALVPKLIGWGAAALVSAAYLAKLAEQLT